MTQQRRLAILRLAFWTAAIFAFVMAIIPQPPQLPGEPSDKIQHMSAFLVLGGLAFFAYPQARRLLIAAGLSLFGAFIEIVQAIPSLHRDADILDWIADTLAAVAILLALQWFFSRRNGSH